MIQLSVTHLLLALDAGPAYVDYDWSDGSSNQSLTVVGSISGVGTHDYSVVVTDINGCKGDDLITIIIEGCSPGPTDVNMNRQEAVALYP